MGLEDLSRIFEKEGFQVYCDSKYLYDETPEFVRVSAKESIVLKPQTTEEVSKILKIASSKRIPVFVRGGGTGLCGGAIPTKRGIIISTEKLRRIEIDANNFCAVCGAGVTLEELIKYSESHGLSFPPHPGSESATIGGMISTNAGGVRAMKYGVMRNYVLGVTAVLPNGKIIRLGGKTIKNNAGYNLMHLLIGSEGTLAIITEATIKLLPPLKKTATITIPFEDANMAIKCVVQILRSGIMPLALEYIERPALEIGEEVSGKKWPPKGEANLMLIVEGKSYDDILSICEKIEEICREMSAVEMFIATGIKEQRDLLLIRSLIYEGLKNDVYEILDVSVPPAKIAEYLERCNEAAEELGFKIINYGHAGDGNIHQHPLRKRDDEHAKEEYEKLKTEFFKIAKELGGTITGEHGVGIVKREDLKKFLSEEEYSLMLRIKEVFDPYNILNPGKVVKL
jgi:glycolate oxidase